ncbi:unnamed protein product, partial [Didymodactylos carnosus]
MSSLNHKERLQMVGSSGQNRQESMAVNEYQSGISDTETELKATFHPWEINIDTMEEDRSSNANIIQMGQYTHRTQKFVRLKRTIPGVLLIAPGGQILTVGQSIQSEIDDDAEVLNNPFPKQQQAVSKIKHNNAPTIPSIIGGKRERLPDETMIRRTMNFENGDFNSQSGIYTWSYDIPIQERKPPQEYISIPTPPPLGLSAFSGKKHHHVKRNVEHIHDSAIRHSTLLMHNETGIETNHHILQMPPQCVMESTAVSPARSLSLFTTWGYQRQSTHPVMKQPYLFKLNHVPKGIKGTKHSALENETFIRRTLDVHGGDIDASLSYTIWVYDMWINNLIKRGVDIYYIKKIKKLLDLFKGRKLDIQDKHFFSALAKHAQTLAKIILKRTDSGHHLIEDAQHAIIENLQNLKQLLDKVLKTLTVDEYKEILKDTLTYVLSRSNLNNLATNDELFMQLMDYPADAFEIYIDERSGKEIIRLKGVFREKKLSVKTSKTVKKETKTVIISEELSVDDFEEVVDDITGEKNFRLKKEVVEQKRLNNLMNANFDIAIDKESGKKIVKLKAGVDGAK